MARSMGPNNAMTSPITVAVTFVLTTPSYAQRAADPPGEARTESSRLLESVLVYALKI